ncbi:MAG TPA: alpha/beta fold hydrolase [Sphaerochaeta sp.]|nr:alpha/beta fold hydrolase [Sphaerochaeta sp.]
MKKHLFGISFIGILLLASLVLVGCRNIAVSPLAENEFTVKTPQWVAWDPSDEYSEYADLATLYGDRTKYTTIEVPLDYADPSIGTLEVAVLKVEAKNPSERLGAILFNPGGPGGDGLAYGLIFNYLWSDANPKATTETGSLFQQLGNQYDLIGFSPRGTGASTRLTCSSDALLLPEMVLSAENSEANISASLHNAKIIAEACLANPLTKYINTEATAHDMDVIRQVLGDEKLNYMGISYGTWLGTWYASLFPDHVGNMLLIGETDITGPLNDSLLLQDLGMQRVFEEILAPYASQYPNIFQLGSSSQEVIEGFAALQGMLKHVLIKALDRYIALPDEADLALFTLRAAIVIDEILEQGQGADQAALSEMLQDFNWNLGPDFYTSQVEIAQQLGQNYYDLVNKKPEKVFLDDTDAVWWAVQCNDAHTTYDEDSWVLQNMLNVVTYPQFGGFYLQNPCLYWDENTIVKPSYKEIPDTASILIVQSEFDPYTPLESALKTFSVLPQSSMILVNNTYQHCIVLPYGNDELDRSVAEFFLHKKQPPRLSIVEGNPLPIYTKISEEKL